MSGQRAAGGICARMQEAIADGVDWEAFQALHPGSSASTWRVCKARLRHGHRAGGRPGRPRAGSRSPEQPDLPDLLDPPDPSAGSGRPVPGEWARLLDGAAKARRETLQARAALKALQEERGREEDLKTAIRRLVAEGPPALPPGAGPAQRVPQAGPPEDGAGPDPGDPGDEGTFVLCVSDVHGGQLLARDGAGGIGSYDFEVMARYADRLARGVARIGGPYVADGRCRRLVVWFGGDLIENRTMHASQKHNTAPLADQIVRTSRILARELMLPLAGIFPEIECHVSPGNHGRIGDKGEFPAPADNLDLLVYALIAQDLAGQAHIRWFTPSTWYAYLDLYGHSYFLAHGDRGLGALNLRSLAGMHQAAKLILGDKQALDVVVVGHYHTPVTAPAGYGTVIANGSWPGAGEYSISLLKGSLPAQKLLYVTRQQALAGDHTVLLASLDEFVREGPHIVGAPDPPAGPDASIGPDASGPPGLGAHGPGPHQASGRTHGPGHSPTPAGPGAPSSPGPGAPQKGFSP